MNESIEYEIREGDGKFWVGHEDNGGEWWDADLDGFDTKEEAEAFLVVLEEQDPSSREAG